MCSTCRKEEVSMDDKKTATIQKSIGGTLYIVESVTSDTARETACDKIERLILGSLQTSKKSA